MSSVYKCFGPVRSIIDRLVGIFPSLEVHKNVVYKSFSISSRVIASNVTQSSRSWSKF